MEILFDRDLAGNVPSEILLSPRLNRNWIPQGTRYRFRQLSYEEERLGGEYYEVDLDIHTDYVNAQALKGNYCVKAGPRYRFQKQNGIWTAKEIGAAESHGLASSCPGCEVGSGRRYRVNKIDPPTAAPVAGLVLKGVVRELNCGRNRNKNIVCKATLDFEFSNSGTKPVIIVQPSGEYSYWLGGTSLSLTKTESEAAIYVTAFAAWPSIYKFPMYEWLANELDKPEPPINVTRTIEPGKHWMWTTLVDFSVADENRCDGAIGVEIGWSEIKRLTSSMWMRVSIEMWPFNVENFKPDLGRKLLKRWNKFGTLYLDGFDGRFSFSHITSQPIELDLRSIAPNVR